MSFFDDASLAFLPSGAAGKDGKAYSIKPTDGTGDFTFSRGSNLAATRVGADGLIEKGRENLILQSNQFDTTWVKSSTTLTSGQTGYDGSSDAWLLTKTASDARIHQNVSFSGVNNFSLYAKAGSLNWIALNNGSSSAWFDLENGVTGTLSGGIQSDIQSVGNGWYRCIIIDNLSSGTIVRVYPSQANGNTSGTSGSIYIQDAQLEIGLAATDYIESGATTGKAGLLEDEPRFDYSGGATCPSLLLEPSRSNLIDQSEYFNYSGYTTFASTFTDNATISPEGLQNAAEMIGDGTTGSTFFRENLAVPSTGQYTYSLFAKYKANSDATNILLNLVGYGSGNGSCFFDIENGVKGTESGVTGGIEDYGNGWYRCYITTNFTDGVDLNGRVQFYLADSAENLFFTPNNANAEAYFYGLQLEAGSYPTSYIPNHSGGSVTRGAEKQEITGLTSTQLNQTEGSIYLELQTYSTDAGRFVITSYPDGASGDTMRFIFGNNIQFSKVDTGGLSYSINPTASKIKVIGTYSGTELKLCVNGGAVQSSSGNFSFTNQPTKVYTHAFIDTIRLFAEVDQLLYFPTALSDADCITLTTL